MVDPNQIEIQQPTIATDEVATRPSPLQCLVGMGVSAVLTLAAYSLSSAIAKTFAATPINTDNFTVYRISTAVRTLVLGMTALATWVFGIAALGLLGLAIQLFVQRWQTKSTSTQDSQ
jgi:hypothetical protein